MRIRLLFIASVLCTATYGCATAPAAPKAAAPADPKAAAQPHKEPVYTTGSRLPSNSAGAVQGVSRDAWQDDRRNASGNQQIFK